MTEYFLLQAGLLIAVVIVIALCGILLRRNTSRGGTDEIAALKTELQAERDIVRTQATETGRLNGRLAVLESELVERRDIVARLEHRVSEQQKRADNETINARTGAATLVERDETITITRAQTAALEADTKRLREQLGVLQNENAQFNANLAHAKQANIDMQAFLVEAQTKLSGAFSELAGKVFDERGQIFEQNVKTATAQSKTDIENLLKPFGDRLGEFRVRVDSLYSEEAKERSQLFGAVTELKTLNQDMATKTAELTRALKGSSKVRGDWGESMLDTVLRSCGLEEGMHFDRQKVTHDDEGARLHPDVVVRLPDDRRVVIDSKVNLIAWQEAMNADCSPEELNDALRRHTAGLRQHVRDLGDKNYPKAVGEFALEMTIAFVPIEGALSAALGFDPALQSHAFDRKVVFASPNTLMAVLCVVERLWTRDKIQREAEAIAKIGGQVLDSLTNFLADFDKVGKGLDDASKAFKNSRDKLSESSQAVIPRARRLVMLGARGKKILSSELQPDAFDLSDAKQIGHVKLLSSELKDDSE